MNSGSLILALDIGTSSLRTALFDAHGRRFGKTTAQEKYTLQVGDDGAAELSVHDLERAARRAMGKTLRVRRETRNLKHRPIAAVGASCFWHSVMGYDAKRKRPTPIYTWEDSRCRKEAEELRAAMNETTYHRRTGCMLRTPYWPAKLRWLKREKRAAGITQWMSPADWIYGRLAGAFTTSLSMASGTGLLELQQGKWDAALLRQLNVREDFLPTISDEPLNPRQQNPALPSFHRFPELAQAQWFPALGDGAASNLGSDAITSTRAALNVGTSAALRLMIPLLPRQLERGLFCYRVDDGRFLLGGAISNAGNLRAWALRELRLPDDPAVLERALRSRRSPQPRLTVLPFWADERSPTWPSQSGGTITGLTYATTALDLLQASTEASYHRLALIADLMERQQRSKFGIIVSGGIRHSPESMQRLANVLGRPLRPCAEPEASLRGAAVHAATQLGAKIEPLSMLPPIRPVPAVARQYAEARQYQILLEARMESSDRKSSP